MFGSLPIEERYFYPTLFRFIVPKEVDGIDYITHFTPEGEIVKQTETTFTGHFDSPTNYFFHPLDTNFIGFKNSTMTSHPEYFYHELAYSLNGGIEWIEIIPPNAPNFNVEIDYEHNVRNPDLIRGSIRGSKVDPQKSVFTSFNFKYNFRTEEFDTDYVGVGFYQNIISQWGLFGEDLFLKTNYYNTDSLYYPILLIYDAKTNKIIDEMFSETHGNQTIEEIVNSLDEKPQRIGLGNNMMLSDNYSAGRFFYNTKSLNNMGYSLLVRDMVDKQDLKQIIFQSSDGGNTWFEILNFNVEEMDHRYDNFKFNYYDNSIWFTNEDFPHKLFKTNPNSTTVENNKDQNFNIYFLDNTLKINSEKSYGNTEIKIYDFNGKELFRNEIDIQKGDNRINLNKTYDGFLIVLLRLNNEYETYKLIKINWFF